MDQLFLVFTDYFRALGVFWTPLSNALSSILHCRQWLLHNSDDSFKEATRRVEVLSFVQLRSRFGFIPNINRFWFIFVEVWYVFVCGFGYVSPCFIYLGQIFVWILGNLFEEVFFTTFCLHLIAMFVSFKFVQYLWTVLDFFCFSSVEKL